MKRINNQNTLKILAVLAIKKEMPQFDLPNQIGTHYTTVLRQLRKLEKQGLVNVARTETSEKKGKDKKIYTLTKTGLLCILGYDYAYKYIDIIAKNYEDTFPLIFGKWDFFKKQGIRDEVVRRLTGAVLHVSENWEKVALLGKWEQEPAEDFSEVEDLYRSLIYSESKIKEGVKKLQHATALISQEVLEFSKSVLLKAVIFGLPKRYKWRYQFEDQTVFLSKLKADPDLSEFIKNMIHDLKDEYEIYLNNLKSWIGWWESSE